MKVFKFGGASIRDFDSIQNVTHILENYKDEKMLIVISAMGKITNALEKVAEVFYEGQKEDALRLFEKVKTYHLNLLKYLIILHWKAATNQLNGHFQKVETLLQEVPVKNYNYYYDQIVCIGELLSSTLVSFFLNEKKISNQWIDVRNILITDSSFRDAKVNWEATKINVACKLLPLFTQNNFVVTQGFIAGTYENESTTLGREGSDYTAAIFADLLDADDATIWKDVNGIMNADPKDFKEAETIEELSYKEVIEMAYYGAQVMHPKTIKPLQNKKIPLYVRSFLDMNLHGTIITEKQSHHLPPIIVYKPNQAMITLQTLDFSFVEGKPINFLREILDELRIKPNLTQNAAISLNVCVDDSSEKIEQIASMASQIFNVQIQRNLTLLTLRHYTTESAEALLKNKEVILLQKTSETIQALLKQV
ncbi:MAG: aspartate kinase [Ginsengibacter sp.]